MDDIFNKITQYHNNKVAEDIAKENAKNNEIENLKKQILGMSDKIKYLIKLGKHCNDNGLFSSPKWNDMYKRQYGYFGTDSWAHNLGFCCEYTRLGIYGGGACNYDLSTDGNVIYVTGSDTLYVLKRFVNEIDQFEKDLLNYIEKKIGQHI